MHAGRHYSLVEVIFWTRRETAIFVVIATVPTLLFALVGWTFLGVPWLPIAMVGTAVAFITGFKNNASYARLWEARQVWGGIVNTSRSFTTQVLGFIEDDGDGVYARLVHRHLAWLTALRFALREPRTWENQQRGDNVEYSAWYRVAEREGDVGAELAQLIAAEEHAYVMARKNRATQLIALQSRMLAGLARAGRISEVRHVELERTLALLLEHQGKCERIKNFPYPRQFSTLNLLFVWLFILLVPFGLLPEFHKLGPGLVWLTIPAGVIVAWVFHTMDKIGESSENPFEGSPNDVPITAMSRTIEIDLREMLGERELPAALQPVNNILM
ncbi:MAG: multidrug transporter [Nannocystis sp.]|uniref:bestrophin family protein n=1 Tax=Nannocystis sp. TaxID=1962667 RepID=UPI0024277279|nr:bestrophin family ion channel [Nannocystis sp.]MBK9758315.1 multidrug transporter [Nannocystis sp.]